MLSRDEFGPSSSWFLEPEGLESPVAVRPQGKERSLGRQRVAVISLYLLALGCSKTARGFLRSSLVAVDDGTKVASQAGRSWILVGRSQDLDLLFPSLDSPALEGFAACPAALWWLGHRQEKHRKVSRGFSGCIYFLRLV